MRFSFRKILLLFLVAITACSTTALFACSGNVPSSEVPATEYKLSVYYVNEETEKMAEPYYANLTEGASYSITSPVIDGYTADKTTVSGKMPNQDLRVVVTYSVTLYSLTVNYYYVDTQTSVRESDVYNLASGASYDLEVPQVPFMETETQEIKGQIESANKEVNVYYDWSLKETDISNGTYVNALPVLDSGISFTLCITTSTTYEGAIGASDWSSLFTADSFTLYNGVMRYTHDDTFSDWYGGTHGNLTTGAKWDACVPYNGGGVVITISVNTDGSIKYYANGKLVFNFTATTKSEDGASVSSLNSAILSEISNEGFAIGSGSKFSGLKVFRAVDDNEALNLFTENYKTVTIKTVNQDNQKYLDDIVFAVANGQNFSYKMPEDAMYVADTLVVEGVATENKTFTVKYNLPTSIKELITTPVTYNGAGIGFNEGTWKATDPKYSIDNLSGNFTLIVKGEQHGYLNDPSSYEWWPWRTAFMGLRNSASKNNARFFRLDWFTMTAGSGITGSWSTSGQWESNHNAAVDTLKNSDFIFAVERAGTNVNIKYTLTSHATQKAYTLTYTGTNVTVASLDFFMVTDNASFTITSALLTQPQA